MHMEKSVNLQYLSAKAGDLLQCIIGCSWPVNGAGVLLVWQRVFPLSFIFFYLANPQVFDHFFLLFIQLLTCS